MDLFLESLTRLKTPSLYGYLFHDFSSYKKNPALLESLYKLRACGKIKKIGFSLYYPRELENLLMDKIEFDIVQIPLNIFDRRFLPYLDELSARKIEVHVRSIFLKGLVFKDLNLLPNYFDGLKPKLAQLKALSSKNNLPVGAICLNFAALIAAIKKIVIGVSTLENLKENIAYLELGEKAGKMLNMLDELKEDDENLILPVNWKI